MEFAGEIPGVWIQMLGEFKVVVGTQTNLKPKFRSRTAEQLLSLLALRLGRTLPRFEARDILWPESDGDRQSQNLRRALADIRAPLSQSGHDPQIVCSDADRLWLDPDCVQTDVHRFKLLTNSGLEGVDEENQLMSAVELYVGPLLPSVENAWVEPLRKDLEERFAQAVERLILILLQNQSHDEALRVGRRAVIAAPLREDIHIALMRAYASAGLRSQAICQFEDLESILDAHWGEPPSPASRDAFEMLDRTVVTRSSRRADVQPSIRQAGGGAIQSSSPFYVVRECDHSLKTCIRHGEGTILVQGPRQVGKTSLLGRVFNTPDLDGRAFVLTDFQVLNRNQLASADLLYRALACGLAMQLGVHLDIESAWNSWLGSNMNLDNVVESILKQVDRDVVWAIDEADRLYGTDLADDFFGLVRSWHNRRALVSSSVFQRLSLVVSYATEAHLFIQDFNQSPFNIGVRIPVRDFNFDEIRELYLRYGAKPSDDDVAKLLEITGGQPYLARKALDAHLLDGIELSTLSESAASDHGPFAEHIRRLVSTVSRDSEMMDEVIRFLKNQPFENPKTPVKLVAGGMLFWRQNGNLDVRVPAYRTALLRHLCGT